MIKAKLLLKHYLVLCKPLILLLLNYVNLTILFFTACAAIWLVARIIESRLFRHIKNKKLVDMLHSDVNSKILPFLYAWIFVICINQIEFPVLYQKYIKTALILLLAIMGVRILITLSLRGIEHLWGKRNTPAEQLALTGAKTLIRIGIWAFALLVILDNLGFKISSLVAGLGIGGVAVALAAQTVLGDLFSYITILFDRPFELGDFVVLGENAGTIEHIGIKTTRIRSLSGEQLILSNTAMTQATIHNYKRLKERRVVFQIGTTYETPLLKLKKIPDMIREIIENTPDTRFDRAHFFNYGDFSLNFEIVFFVLDADYNRYMDIRQTINFNIKSAFEKEGIEFAYPTQTLFVKK